MDPQDWRISVAPGEALLARTGATVVLAHALGDDHDALVAAVLAQVEQASVGQPGAPGRAVVRKVCQLLGAAEGDLPALGVLSATNDGVALLLVGEMEAEISAPGGGTQRVSGRDASTWVDRVLRFPLESLVLRVHGWGETDPRTDVRDGVVHAGAVALVAAGGAVAAPGHPAPGETAAAPPLEAPSAPASASDDAAPVDEPTQAQPRPPRVVDAPPAPSGGPADAPPPTPTGPAFVAVSLTDRIPADELVPLPMGAEPARETIPVYDGVEVQGIVCSRGHFNDPNGLYCATCGIAMVQQTHNLVAGRRPPLGVLVLDDGSVFTVDGDYVLGREPENADDVVAGKATPLPLDDIDQTLSRVHLKVHLEGWDVQLVDLHSANGTYVSAPGAAAPTRLVPDLPLTVSPGTRVSLGGRSLVFDSYRRT